MFLYPQRTEVCHSDASFGDISRRPAEILVIFPIRKRMIRCILVFVLLTVLAAPAATQEASTANAVTLRPGDLVEIEIWREDDLSGRFLVDESGNVVLPLLGERNAIGRDLPSFRRELLEEYRKHLVNPSIIITPLRRVYVLGSVREPGLYEVDPTISLAGVVAMAGIPSGIRDLRRIRIIRDGEVVLDGVRSEAALVTVDVRSGDQIFVEQRSWWDRNRGWVMTTAASLGTSIILVLLR